MSSGNKLMRRASDQQSPDLVPKRRSGERSSRGSSSEKRLIIPTTTLKRRASDFVIFGRRATDYMKVTAVGSGLLFCGIAEATNNGGSQTVSMSLSGNVYSTPAWKVNGTASNSATYTFASFTGTTVTTAGVTLLLSNVSTLGGDGFTVTMPTGCKIGATAVNATLQVNGHNYTANGALTSTDYTALTTSSGTSTDFEFTGVPAGTTGTVSGCSTSSIAYTY